MEKHPLSLALCSALFFSFASITAAQWIQNSYPWAGDILTFASIDDMIFAGTNGGGVFRSSDDGQTWDFLPLNTYEKWVYALTVMDTTLFAGTLHGTHYSLSNGDIWTSGNLHSHTRGLAVIGTTLFAGTDGSGICYSTDNDSTWIKVDTTSARLMAYAFISVDNFVIAGTGRGIVRSSDNGITWDSAQSGIHKNFVYSLAEYSGTAFAGTYGGGIYRSIDNGLNWTAANDGIADSSTGVIGSVYAFAVNENILFAATDHGVFRSENEGTSWTAVNSGLADTAINSIYAMNGKLFAGTCDEYGVFLSTDNGENWSDVNVGIANKPVASLAVLDSTVFAGTAGKGIYRSFNYGKTWKKIHAAALSNETISSLGIIDNDIYASTPRGVFLSSDNGDSWTGVNTGLTDREVRCLEVLKNKLVAGTPHGVFILNRGTAEWTVASSGMANANVTCLATSGDTLFAATLYRQIYCSTDEGANWDELFTVMTPVRALAVSGNHIFTGTDSLGVFIHEYSGSAWEERVSGLRSTNYIRSLIASGTSLFASTVSSGIHLSTDNGATWTIVNSGLQEKKAYDDNVVSFALHGNTIFAGTAYGGVYRRQLSEMIIPSDVRVRRVENGSPFYEMSLQKQIGSMVCFKISLPREGDVSVTVHDLTGREMASLVNRYHKAGIYQYLWNTHSIAAGYYIARLQAGTSAITKTIQIVR